MSNENGQEYEEKDDHIVQFVVSKAEERKILLHSQFETVCAKFWNLMKGQAGTDLSSDFISSKQYSELLSRIYKVLACLYRESEMKNQIAQEWTYDCHGKAEMDQNLFSKFLFRIAHQWCASIDLEEYCELLEKIFERITARKIVRADGSIQIAIPQIRVTVDQEKQAQAEEEEVVEEWEDCEEDEPEVDEFEYQMKEVEGDLFKQRRPKQLNKGEKREVFLSSREPFYYHEVVVYHHQDADNNIDVAAPSNEDYFYHVLADHNDVFPFGYPTEQYLCWLKNDVYRAHQVLKAEKKAAIASMQRDLFNGTQTENKAPQLSDKDAGLLQVFNMKVTQYFKMHRTHGEVRVKTFAYMHDGTYNQFREMLKDLSVLSIRPSMEFPKRTKKDKENLADLTLPLKRKSAFGYNPVIERRLNYKQSVCQMAGQANPQKVFVNVNYLIVDPVYETAYRSDVTRVETTARMAIKPSDDFVREEDFCNVTVSFRDTLQIMLQKKYETFFTIKLQGDEEEAVDRDEKIFQLEKNRKRTTKIVESLTSKGLQENYEERSFLKLMKGPFYKLISKEGPREDDFYTCGTKDLIKTVNSETMKVLITGKPRSGKTTLAKAIEKRLNLARISADVWIQNLFKKIKDREENPPEEEPEPVLEEGQEPPPKKDWMLPLDRAVLNALQSGSAPTPSQIDTMLKELVESPEAQTKGFVIDIDFSQYSDKTWAKRFEEAKIMQDKVFTHVVELIEDPNETLRKASQLRATPQDGIVFSKWERDERAKPKKPLAEDEEPPEEDEENAIKPLNPNELVFRVCDNLSNIQKELNRYENNERPDMDDYIVKLFNSTYIKLQSAGLTPDEVADSVVYRLKPSQEEPLVPVATIIEGGAGSFKDLLTQEVNTEDGQLPRQWSLWKTTDPVALKRGKVQPGLPEFAAHYANNVFVFATEENLKAFAKEPRAYLGAPPEMPPDFRILMLGPNGAGVPEQAALLEKQYGWRVVDFQQIVRNKLQSILQLPMKPPNNITDIGPCMICLSNEELQEIKDGKLFPAWKFLPWVMEYLGVPLAVQPKVEQVVVEPNPDEMNEEEKKAYEKEQKKKAEEKKKKDKEEEEARKAKEDRAKRRAEAIEAGQDLAEMGLEESEEEIKIDDLPITRIVVAKDAEGNLPKIGQFILYGFPQTEVHINKLKEFGIGFDRIVFLNDNTEEEPGREIKQKMAGKGDIAYEWDDENAKAQKVLATVKEFIGEEGILEVDCTGSNTDVLIKIRTKLDPFFTLVDNADDVRTSADLDMDDENTKRLPKSDFGDFCPVTYVKQNFLVKGSTEFESSLNGKTYRFFSEEDKKEFEFNPTRFIQNIKLPLAPPPPKIMIIGLKGSGVSTQIKMLCDKFKIDSLALMDEFLKQTKIEKEKRKRSRLLARGFKAPQPVEDEEAEPEADPEIEEEAEGFDQDADAVSVLQKIIVSSKALVIDGNWTTLPEGSIETSLDKLLTDSRRAPEIVIVLKCKEKSTFDRCIDDQKIRDEYEADKKKREAEILAKREEDKKAKLVELEAENKQDPEAEDKKSPEEIAQIIKAAIEQWEADRIEEDNAAYEADPVPDYATRREEIDTKMREQLEKDAAFLESFVEGLKGEDTNNPKVQIVEPINSDISAEYVHIKILDKLKNHIQFREDLIEREQVQILKPAEVKFYEASHTYKHSKFGKSSPLSQFNPSKTREFALLYRERIYFLSNKSEQQKFMIQPSKYTLNCEPTPIDLEYRPTAAVIGLPQSGKTTLATIISQKTGMIHLKPEEIIEYFVNKESEFSEKLRRRIQLEGSEIDDTTFIDMLAVRIQLKDCKEKGWVLDGFPQNRAQAVQMAKFGINPDNVFNVQVPPEEIYKRSAALSVSDFGCNRTILVRRLTSQARTIPQTSFFYQKYFNSLVSVNGLKSRWYMEDLAMTAIEKNNKARLEFARDYFFQSRPCIMENLNYDRVLLKQSLSQYVYMCPVSWKVHKKFVNCCHNAENAVLYNNYFYYFASIEDRDIFVKHPKKFTEQVLFCQDRNVPKRYRAHKAAEIISQEKSLLGHCPVSLKDEERVEKGYQLTVVSFKDSRFVFASEEKATRFFQNPSRYSSVQLPVKMPPIKDPVLLFQLQKQDDSITFMEQALGQVVTRGLREVGENRLKYPTLSVKETMLKLFAIFLKAENPANTTYMRDKYRAKMKEFIYKCEVPQELYELSLEKKEKQNKDRKWPQFKEDYYNRLGEKFDQIMQEVPKEISLGFASYMK